MWRGGSLIGALMLTWACGTGQPTAPGPPATIAQPPSQLPQRLPSGDPLGTYEFSGAVDYPVRGFTAGSRYLLYDDGVFGLQYDAFPHVYLGTYRQQGTTITFRFGGQWTWGEGYAMGTLEGDLLVVRYSDIMTHSDFENAAYRRSP